MSFFRSRNIRFTQVTNGSICFLKFPEGHPWLTGKKWKALGGCTSGLGYNHPETMSHGYQPISCIYGQRWGQQHNHGFQKLNVIALPNCDSFSGLWILAIYVNMTGCIGCLIQTQEIPRVCKAVGSLCQRFSILWLALKLLIFRIPMWQNNHISNAITYHQIAHLKKMFATL